MIGSHESALRALQGLRLRCAGRACDLLWLHFGDYRTVVDRRGMTREVGEWALHLQCPWRFIRSNSIVLASTDFYYYPEGEDSYDFQRGGESLFDRRANQFNRVLDTGEFRVSNVSCGVCGEFRLTLSPELHFSVFPAASDGSPFGEFWRLFRPSEEEPHYVVSTEGTEHA
jgi:hypothetical protein